MKRVYLHKRTLFVQRELEFEEDLVVREIVGKLFSVGLEEDVEATGALGKIIDELLADGGLRKLFKVVLKLHEPTPLHRMWNRFIGKADASDPIRGMPNSLVARVLRDFFVLNGRWIPDFVSSALNLDWRSLMMKQVEAILSKQSSGPPVTPSESSKH